MGIADKIVRDAVAKRGTKLPDDWSLDEAMKAQPTSKLERAGQKIDTLSGALDNAGKGMMSTGLTLVIGITIPALLLAIILLL